MSSRYDVHLVADAAAAVAMMDIHLIHRTSQLDSAHPRLHHHSLQSSIALVTFTLPAAESTSRDAIRLPSVVTKQRKHALTLATNADVSPIDYRPLQPASMSANYSNP